VSATTSAQPEAQWRGQRGRPAMLPLLALLLLGALLLGVGLGPVAVPPDVALAILLGKAGVALDVPASPQQAAVLWNIRLPRVLLGALVGAALAVSGALLQGVFRNPLADPGLIGVSSGAALGAVAVIVLGVAPLGPFTLPLAAFLATAAPRWRRCCWSAWRSTRWRVQQPACSPTWPTTRSCARSSSGPWAAWAGPCGRACWRSHR
jgi:iron complex transport system permease protein